MVERGESLKSSTGWAARFRALGRLLIASGVFTCSAFAAVPAPPFWTELALFRFGEDLFFVGGASCAPTVQAGRDQAFQRGLQQVQQYGRLLSTVGLTVNTQAVYYGRAASGCPEKTVSVWRLVRLNAEQMTALPKAARSGPAEEPSTAPPDPPDLTPRIGMSRIEIMNRFGQASSMKTRRERGDIVWEYQDFGLSLEVDGDGVLKGWTLARPWARVAGSPIHKGMTPDTKPETRPAQAQDAPPLDLRERRRGPGIAPARQPASPALAEAIRANCERRWSTDLSRRATCEHDQYEGFQELSRARPQGIAPEQFELIQADCEKRWPDDFSLRAACQRNDIDRIGQLQRQRRK